jgi:hypothetical protein
LEDRIGKTGGSEGMMKKKNLHTQIKNAVKEFLQWHKWYVVEIANGPFGTKGVSDLIAVRRGATCFIEIKTPTGELSPHQLIFRSEISGHGNWYLLINEVDTDWFKTLWG